MKKLKSIAVTNPMFHYFSVCCNVQAEKRACVRVPVKERETNSLGKFRCGQCHKRCKVQRRKNPDYK
jgi:hypothetical protein